MHTQHNISTHIPKWLSYCLIVFILTRLWIYFIAYLGNGFILNSLFIHLGAQSPENWFVHWDSKWYLSIITQGYSTIRNLDPSYAHYQNYAFFPLYPLLVKGLSFITHGNPIIIGQILSNLLFLFSLSLFYQLLIYYFDAETAGYGTLLLAISPANIYFVSIYTESLFLLLSLTCWLAALHKKWFLMGIAGMLLSATRPTGILIILPMLAFIITDYKVHRQYQNTYLFILLIPLGLLAFMAYLWQHVGDPLAFKHAESAWDRTGWHFHNLYYQFRDQVHSLTYNFWMGVLALFLMIVLYKKAFKKEALFFLLLLLPAFSSGVFDSIGRYSAGAVFPFYLGIILLSRQHLYAMFTTLIIAASCLSIYILSWMQPLYPLA
jgi:Gpi18-like mannosyltransferase